MEDENKSGNEGGASKTFIYFYYATMVVELIIKGINKMLYH